MKSVPCKESLSRLPTYVEELLIIESVSFKPYLLFEFPASKETSGKQRKIRQNIAEVKQTRMFSVMADEAADVSTLHRIFERSVLVSAIVEKKQPVTQSRS